MRIEETLERYNAAHPQARVETSTQASGDFVLALSGELDMKTSNDLVPLLEAAVLACPAKRRFILDLAKVGYISSTGVGLLTTAMVAAEKRDAEFILLDVPPRVKNVMDTLGLVAFFKIEDSRE